VPPEPVIHQPSIVPPLRSEPLVSLNKRRKDAGGILYITLTREEEETVRDVCYRARKTRTELGREALRDIFEKYRHTM
jgi:hypothetical protein